MGRPTIYSEEIADRLCERLATGTPLITLCKEEGMPSETTVYRWLQTESHSAFREKYAHARERQADYYAEEIIKIADDGTRDTRTDEDGNEVTDYDHIQRAKLRVDARKWFASKVAPKKYGDRIAQEITGAEGGPVVISADPITEQEWAAKYGQKTEDE